MRMTLAVATARNFEVRSASGESQRVAFLTRHFRMWYAIVEREVLDALDRLTGRDYLGRWLGHDLGNGGCFLAPVAGNFRVETSRGAADVDAETAGIIATLAALQSLTEQHPTKEIFATRMQQLRELACQHAKAETILAAV
jgi:hypothetical protein